MPRRSKYRSEAHSTRRIKPTRIAIKLLSGKEARRTAKSTFSSNRFTARSVCDSCTLISGYAARNSTNNGNRWVRLKDTGAEITNSPLGAPYSPEAWRSASPTFSSIWRHAAT